MSAAIGFMRGLLRMPGPWRIWVGLLLAVNLGLPWFYIGHAEAWATLIAISVGGIIQIAIYGKLGFVRLLGIGHIFWLGLVPWLWFRLDATADEAMRVWMISVIICNTLSIIIDISDVVRYVRGERAPVSN